jgi:WXXGXW repeat (2 copies)
MRFSTLIRYLFFTLILLSVPTASFAQFGISVSFGPPAIPVYEQPICPGDGYIWTPGYWAWDGNDYYWVPGTWVLAPEVGFFWTPGYWGWGGSAFIFQEGYWGPHVGFYGGINYGFGYFGHGYEGGRWDGGHYFYNRSVNNVDVNVIHNVYEARPAYNNTNRVSYNGGNGGIDERASSQEQNYSRERHIAPVAAQVQHVQAARGNRELGASVNQGRPPIAATQRPGGFNDHAVPATEAGGRYEPPANRGSNAARPPVHASELPPLERPAAPNTGNPKLDQKYQQQQQNLYNRQSQERQKAQQQQEAEHQKLARPNVNPAKAQQVEQRHQQQTQQLQQRHVQQQQQMQQRQPQSRQSQPNRR